MTKHQQMIEIVAALLAEREGLEIVLSEDESDHFGADAFFMYSLFELKDGFEVVNTGSFSNWIARGEVIAAYATVYGGAYDIAVQVCGFHLRRDIKLPEPLRRFCVGVMEGTVTRPKSRILGKGRDKHWMRNEVFIRYMKFLTSKCEYKPQRGPASEPTSAADILAAAFHECGYQMITYDTILNVWKDKVFRGELDAILCR